MTINARTAQALLKEATTLAEYSKDVRKAGTLYLTERANETAHEAIAKLREAQELMESMIAELESSSEV